MPLFTGLLHASFDGIGSLSNGSSQKRRDGLLMSSTNLFSVTLGSPVGLSASSEPVSNHYLNLVAVASLCCHGKMVRNVDRVVGNFASSNEAFPLLCNSLPSVYTEML
jgi:hypothetical protein